MKKYIAIAIIIASAVTAQSQVQLTVNLVGSQSSDGELTVPNDFNQNGQPLEHYIAVQAWGNPTQGDSFECYLAENGVPVSLGRKTVTSAPAWLEWDVQPRQGSVLGFWFVLTRNSWEPAPSSVWVNQPWVDMVSPLSPSNPFVIRYDGYGAVTVEWIHADYIGCYLYSTPSLNSPITWTYVNVIPTTVDGGVTFQVVLPSMYLGQFFKLSN